MEDIFESRLERNIFFLFLGIQNAEYIFIYLIVIVNVIYLCQVTKIK